MKRGRAFTPDGPLTIGDLREIVSLTGDTRSDQIVEIRTPMGPDRRQVTVTVTDERCTYVPALEDTDAEQVGAETEGNEH